MCAVGAAAAGVPAGCRGAGGRSILDSAHLQPPSADSVQRRAARAAAARRHLGRPGGVQRNAGEACRAIRRELPALSSWSGAGVIGGAGSGHCSGGAHPAVKMLLLFLSCSLQCFPATAVRLPPIQCTHSSITSPSPSLRSHSCLLMFACTLYSPLPSTLLSTRLPTCCTLLPTCVHLC